MEGEGREEGGERSEERGKRDTLKLLFSLAGTGTTAASLIALFECFDKPTHVHVVHMAEDEMKFKRTLTKVRQQLWQQLEELGNKKNLGKFRPGNSTNFTVHRPLVREKGNPLPLVLHILSSLLSSTSSPFPLLLSSSLSELSLGCCRHMVDLLAAPTLRFLKRYCG